MQNAAHHTHARYRAIERLLREHREIKEGKTRVRAQRPDENGGCAMPAKPSVSDAGCSGHKGPDHQM